MRLLTKSDGVDFSVSEARTSGGKSSDLWYKNYWEANYVRSGQGLRRKSQYRRAVAPRTRRSVLRRPH